ncbi:MAG: cobalamin-binding protein [Thiomonas sp. 15-66-11]|nr:MAG: cobalamin-binding protein [Thiomonas sp. 15-66-11]
MNDRTSPATLSDMSIAAVERDTGIPKDTLRVWERRYGFPMPLRDALQERLYPVDQVKKLHLIKRLMAAGHRPGRIVARPVEELQALARESLQASTPPAAVRAIDALKSGSKHYLRLVKQHDAERLKRELMQAQMRLGLGRFVTEIVAPLVADVGQAWMRGDLEIFEEHQFSETLHRVLLTTIPHEPHGLGLLMAEAMLALEGCHCVSLGVQTPVSSMLLAAQAHHADVLALSFSALPTQTQVLEALAELRSRLPETIEVWAGGSSPALRRAPNGVRIARELTSLPDAIRTWRQTHSPVS